MNVKFGLVLDKPNQFLNKGSNCLFLGDFEYCNAGDRSARIYVSDSNGDVVEVEDDAQGELLTLREKIIKITENLPSETWKPKLIYLVKSDSTGNQKYNQEAIKNLYQYYMNNKNNLKPYHIHTNSVGITHKLIPYIDERVVFGIIEGDKVEDLINIFHNLANEYLNTSNHLFTNLYNTVMKYNLNFSEAYNQIANVMDQFDKLLVETVKVYLQLEKLKENVTSVKGGLGCPDKIYTTTKFVNGTANRYSIINFSSKNPNKDQIDEPFVDMVVVALSGSSIVKYCSFRLDKRTQSISNFYGDSTQFYFENMNKYPKLPLHVKNRFTYKIITNWDLNLVDTLSTKIIPSNYSIGFTGVSNDVQLEDLYLVYNNKKYYFNCQLDEYNGRILNIISEQDGSVLNSLRSESVSIPNSPYIKFYDGSINYFFPLGTNKIKSGVQPVIFNPSTNKTYYIQHIDPVIVQLAYSKLLYTSSLSGYHSNPGYGNMSSTVVSTGCGFGSYVELSVSITNQNTRYKFDSIFYQMWIYNLNDQSKYISKSGNIDPYSDFVYGGGEYRHVLTASELAHLGGKNTMLGFKGRIAYDSASSMKRTDTLLTAKFYLTTK